MSEQPRLYLDSTSWPRWLKAIGFLVLLVLLIGMFFAPSPLYQPIIFLFIFGQVLERFWKRKKVGFITRADDPHIFWFFVVIVGAMVIFSLWLMVDAIGRMI